jgi:GAF domain-containing protein
MEHAAEFARIASELAQQPDVDQTLNGITRLAQESLACDYAGIHLVRGRHIDTAAATDPIIEKADRLQSDLGEGPCLSAIWDHGVYVVHDTAADERWPRFAPMAAELGLHSVLSVQLATGDGELGALNLYSREVRRFEPDDVAEAVVFAQHASLALSSARRESNLVAALDSRHLIGQAQGILMERFDLDAAQAFAVLRRYSQDNNVKVRDVAAELAQHRRLPD